MGMCPAVLDEVTFLTTTFFFDYFGLSLEMSRIPWTRIELEAPERHDCKHSNSIFWTRMSSGLPVSSLRLILLTSLVTRRR